MYVRTSHRALTCTMSDTFNVSRTSCVEADNEPADESQHDEYVGRVKKRKLRRGTQNALSTMTATSALAVIRRGTRCMSPHFTDDDAQATANAASASASATATRLQRIESMVAQLTSHIQNLSQTQSNPPTLYTPVTSSSPSPTPRATLSRTAPPDTIYGISSMFLICSPGAKPTGNDLKWHGEHASILPAKSSPVSSSCETSIRPRPAAASQTS